MARFVAMTIAMHARGANAPQSRCSHAQLAQWTGLCRRTVITAMGELVDREYLVSVKQHTKSGARAASLHLLIHPVDTAQSVDNSPARKGTKVQEMHRGSAGDAHHGGAGDAHLEDEGSLQDASPVLDLMSRLAAGKAMP
jgi:DNA-binding transcriptional MocR family regulator